MLLNSARNSFRRVSIGLLILTIDACFSFFLFFEAKIKKPTLSFLRSNISWNYHFIRHAVRGITQKKVINLGENETVRDWNIMNCTANLKGILLGVSQVFKCIFVHGQIEGQHLKTFLFNQSRLQNETRRFLFSSHYTGFQRSQRFPNSVHS